MDVAANFRNGSKNVPTGKNGCPNPSYFNEFTRNKIEVGHRAPHLNPATQSRDNFWQQPVRDDHCTDSVPVVCGTGHAPTPEECR